MPQQLKNKLAKTIKQNTLFLLLISSSYYKLSLSIRLNVMIIKLFEEKKRDGKLKFFDRAVTEDPENGTDLSWKLRP
ncbi:MAG: hypothetical protein CMI29_04295 [Opitutae bacterium]|nr:hypothetical protein [Opitutae bacterium]